MFPIYGLFGLSGDAAIPLVLGNFLNIYAAIGAILTIDLTVKEVFIIAIMLSFSHAVDRVPLAQKGSKVWIVVAVRLGLAFFSAIVINFVWQGGRASAKYGAASVQSKEIVQDGFNRMPSKEPRWGFN